YMNVVRAYYNRIWNDIKTGERA
ncbi:MAG: hypothetical protein V7642_1603, partial [Burkholderiales bacterium]